MKTELKDVTFIIPIRLDSIIRLENLIMTVKNLRKYFNTNITILEASNYSNGFIPKLLGKDVKYIFIEDRDKVFYRTKYLNYMSTSTDTPYIGIWDSDIIIHQQQIIDSITHLRSKEYDIAYPYEKSFLDTGFIIRELYLQKKQISVLERHKAKMCLLYGEIMLGGAIFVNREKYAQSGFENENFYGWGPEDGERYYRWKALDYKIYRSKGELFHLTHPRDINGQLRSKPQSKKMMNELLDNVACSKKEMIEKCKELTKFENQ
jgi:predicted glycosyltransferase involved in capsule biosynthesis